MSMRVIQWASGGVARKCVAAIAAHPALELVGMYAWSEGRGAQGQGDNNMEPLGWGLPANAPCHKEQVMEETRVFADALELRL